MLTAVLLTWTALAQPTEHSAVRWSHDVHRLICEIAWRELMPDAREQVRELLRLDPVYDSFPDACVWADDVRRRDPAYSRFTTAHYVNLPRGAAGFDLQRDCGATYCVVEAIRDMAAVLDDRTSDRSDRLDALKFLGHFVGDIHQPLHAGYGDDRGGNDRRVTLTGRDITLHWLWDGLLIERLQISTADAARLHAEIQPVDRTRWANLAPEVWAEESYQLVVHQVYRGIEDGEIELQYIERNRYTVERQLMKAGVRLGAMLNRILGQ